MTFPRDNRHLLSPDGEAALAEVIRRQPLLAFDFDGTLAPIVSRPHAARISVAVRRRLALLSALLPVAVITGRMVSDVVPRLGFQPRFVIGNHGAEDPGAIPEIAIPELDPLRARVRLHAQALHAAGVEVEDKGYSMAFHYRLASDRPAALDMITSVVRDPQNGIRIFGGKCVVNVAPENAPNKADALETLVRRCGAQRAIFVGDDVNDEVVFARAPPEWLTVRVGRDDPATRARYLLDSVAEVGMMLHRMLDFTRRA